MEKKGKPGRRRGSKVNLGRHYLIASMLTHPGITHKQVAEACGCGLSTVGRISMMLNAEVSRPEIEALRRGHYVGLVEKALPVSKRATNLARLANKRSDKAALSALKALVYIDQLAGIAPTQREKGQEGDYQGPVFILPEGTQLNFNMERPLDRRIAGTEDEPIDVTPMPAKDSKDE